MLRLPLVLFVWSLALFRVEFAVGTLVNFTIDDTNPGPGGSTITYLPDGAWNIGQDCSGCFAQPDPAQLLDGTWHDGTFNPVLSYFPNETLTASVSFNGTAVYVFCVLARTTISPDGDSDMTFFIDGEKVGKFFQKAPGTTGYDYNVSVFSTTSLSPAIHTLTIQAGSLHGNVSLILLDSIVYSSDDGVSDSSPPSVPPSSSVSTSPSSSSATPNSLSDPSSSSKKSKSGIVAAVVVPVVVVGLVIVAAIFFRRRRRRRQQIIHDNGTTAIDSPPIETARISTAAHVHANGPAMVPVMSTITPSPSSHLTFSGANGQSMRTRNRFADGVIHRVQQSLVAVKRMVLRQNIPQPDVSTPVLVHSMIPVTTTPPSSSLVGAGAITLEENIMYPEEDPPAYV